MEFVVVVVVGAFFFGGSRFLFGLLALPLCGAVTRSLAMLASPSWAQ
jgi:hypothetical protein